MVHAKQMTQHLNKNTSESMETDNYVCSKQNENVAEKEKLTCPKKFNIFQLGGH